LNASTPTTGPDSGIFCHGPKTNGPARVVSVAYVDLTLQSNGEECGHCHDRTE